MPRAIGIDLGTTNSAMAVMEGGEPIATPSAGTTVGGWGAGSAIHADSSGGSGNVPLSASRMIRMTSGEKS